MNKIKRKPLCPRRTFLAILILLIWSGPAISATIHVDNNCSLIDAIIAANTDTAQNGCEAGNGADEIIITSQAPNTIQITTIDNSVDGSNGLPDITTTITITGNHHTITRSPSPLNPTAEYRLFHVAATGNLTLNSLTLSNGVASGAGYAGKGGAIYNFYGTLTLTNCTVSGNSASDGGGINSRGTLTLTNSTVSGNSASDGGGGISGYGTTTLTNSTVSGNSASHGGGISSSFGVTTTLTNSTVSGNSASFKGGGINIFYGTLALTSSTVSGNSAPYRGGISGFRAITTLTNSTVSGNSMGIYADEGITTLISSTVSGNGVGILIDRGHIELTNTIIANSTGGDCALGIFASATTSPKTLIEDGSCGATLTGDPALGPLADNGGPTKTHALLAGSPAIDAAGQCGLPTDQRGEPRSVCKCDIGAYERTEASPDNSSCTSFFVVPIPGGKTVIFGL